MTADQRNNVQRDTGTGTRAHQLDIFESSDTYE
jgi:hypothetical protein